MKLAVYNALLVGKVDPIAICCEFHDYLPDERPPIQGSE